MVQPIPSSFSSSSTGTGTSPRHSDCHICRAPWHRPGIYTSPMERMVGYGSVWFDLGVPNVQHSTHAQSPRSLPDLPMRTASLGPGRGREATSGVGPGRRLTPSGATCSVFWDRSNDTVGFGIPDVPWDWYTCRSGQGWCQGGQWGGIYGIHGVSGYCRRERWHTWSVWVL